MSLVQKCFVNASCLCGRKVIIVQNQFQFCREVTKSQRKHQIYLLLRCSYLSNCLIKSEYKDKFHSNKLFN